MKFKSVTRCIIWRLLGNSFLVTTYFLIRDYNTLLQKELHRSLQVSGLKANPEDLDTELVSRCHTIAVHRWEGGALQQCSTPDIAAVLSSRVLTNTSTLGVAVSRQHSPADPNHENQKRSPRTILALLEARQDTLFAEFQRCPHWADGMRCSSGHNSHGPNRPHKHQHLTCWFYNIGSI